MGTKIKGLLKGLRFISQKFDEGKEQEMKIGYPTDVKHVAHIGWDGPSVDSPSWMKEFRSPQTFQSAPLSVNGKPMENPEIKWVSQDSSRRGSRSQNSASNDMPELPKSSRRHSLGDGDGSTTITESPTRDSSTKSRQSRRHSSKSSRQPKDSVLEPDSSSRGQPDIPKKSRRKSKDSVSGGSTRSSRSKANAPTPYTSVFSDPGPDTESGSINGELSQSSSLKPFVKEGDKGCNGVS